MAPTVRSSTRAKTIRTAKTSRTEYKKKKKHQKQFVEQHKIDNVEKTSSMEDLPPSTSCTTTTATTTTSTSDNFSKTDDHHQGLDTSDQASADNNKNNNIPTSGCSTPKAQRFRIPEIVTCPPAPKKQRVVSNCSLQRTPIAFFAPPDLELFFFCALHDISV